MTDEKTITLDREKLMLAARYIHYGAEMLLAMLVDAGAIEIVEARLDEPEEVEEDDEG